MTRNKKRIKRKRMRIMRFRRELIEKNMSSGDLKRIKRKRKRNNKFRRGLRRKGRQLKGALKE